MNRDTALNQEEITLMSDNRVSDYKGIVVDSNNVAFDQKNSKEGDRPDFLRLNVIEENYGHRFSIIYMVSDRQERKVRKEPKLQELIKKDQIVFVPFKEMDDFLLSKGKQGYGIISNDKFQKEITKYPHLTKMIENQRLPFTWIEKSQEIIIPRLDL
jgi:hypothetical protein